MELCKAFALALREQKIDCIFGLVGNSNLFMANSFRTDAGGTFIAASNEAGAVLMANGYARVTKRLGVATVTSGPGLTNTITALVEASRDRCPLLLIAGDAPVGGERQHIHKIAQHEIVLGSGAGFESVRSPTTALKDLDVAMQKALARRGPMVLSVPEDLWWCSVEDPTVQPIRMLADQAIHPGSDALDISVGIIANARRPIVLAGGGAATSPGAQASLVRLAQRIGAPVATSLKGKDLFLHDPFDLGIFGTLASPVALEVIAQSDCIVAFGASLNRYTTDRGGLLQGKSLVQVDVDREAIGRHVKVDGGVVGDAQLVSDAIVTWLDEAEIAPSGFRSDALAGEIAASRMRGATHTNSGDTLSPESAVTLIDKMFPADRILVCDVGRFVYYSLRGVHVADPSCYVNAMNFGAIGLGMGMAIGAAVGKPGQPVLLMSGDGGFMLGGLNDFNTAVRHGLDIVAIVFDDGAYGAEHVQLRDRQMDPRISMYDWPNLASVAIALGGQGFTVRTDRDLTNALDAVAQRHGPMLIDIKLDPDKVVAEGH